MNADDPIIRQVYAETPAARRCPHLRADAPGTCRCASPTCSSPAAPLGALELQLWCLAGPERHVACIAHPAYQPAEPDEPEDAPRRSRRFDSDGQRWADRYESDPEAWPGLPPGGY